MSRVGKIKAVCCKNFVTYSECVFNPSEYLNVIIGPNGTGKSTLVSAIVLSLGGEPILLARSTSIGEYVKNGCESAKVSVEIYDNNDPVDVKTTLFERTFDINNKNNFYVNGQQMSKKNFLEIVSKYNIQISNLCQFLPQDKVQDFAKIEPPEILANTINSVCQSKEIEYFKKLKELRNEQKSGNSDREKLKQKLEETKLRIEELNVQLERYNARKGIEEKLNVCNAKKLFLECEKLNIDYIECENDHQVAKTNLKKFDKEFRAIVNKKDMIESTKEKLKKDIDEKDRNLKVAEMRKTEIIKSIENLKKKIDEEKTRFEKRKRERDEKQKELIEKTKILEIFAQDLRNLNESKAADAQRKIECERKINECKIETKRFSNNLREISNKLNDSIPEINNLKIKLKNLENETEQKLQLIRHKYPDVFKAINWLDSNMELFQGRVYKPLIMELSVSNPNYAKYLENTISHRDLFAFSCENADDVSTFTTELCVKQNLMLNIFHAPTPDESIFIPRLSIDEIRQYGFQGYLIDILQGPPALLAYLCSLYQIQNIPYGSDNVNNFTQQIPDYFKCYFAGDMCYRCTVSKYGNRERSLTQSKIKGRRLLSSKDDEEINKIKKRLAELCPITDSLRNQRTPIEAELRRIELCATEHNQTLKEINGKCKEFEQKSAQLKRHQCIISELKKDIIGIPEMEKDLKTLGTKYFKEIMLLQYEKQKALKLFQEAISGKAYSKLKMSIFQQENEELENVIKSAEENRNNAQKRVDIISNKCNDLKRHIKAKSTEANSLLNNMDPNNVQYPHHDYYVSLPNTLDEIRESIHDLSGRLDCMDDIDAEIVREYDERRRDADSIKNQIESNENGDQNYNTQIKTIYNKWYPKIEKIISTINGHFSDFMHSMGYVGEVKLVRKEEFDFDTYGIEILVQYRKNVALQPLSRNVQSGGERAVAIAVYTLSMQHITHVPFRCVDEINQGMDARNERKIFEMLVDETTKENRSQYFFVTPKLLRNLKTHERMSVHVVFNGRMIESQNVFSFSPM